MKNLISAFSQIWIAICDYLLLAIAKKVYHVNQDLYILSAAIGKVLFERKPLAELFVKSKRPHNDSDDGQLNLMGKFLWTVVNKVMKISVLFRNQLCNICNLKSKKVFRRLVLLLSVLLMPLSANSQILDDIRINTVKKQAEAGNVDKQFFLGYYYENRKRNLQQAKYWYEKAVAGGHESAKPYLGLIYEKEKNYSKAYTLFLSYVNNPQNEDKASANSIYNLSIARVGNYKANGKGTVIDINGAIEWLEKARNTDFPPVLTELYACYSQLKDSNKMFIVAQDIYNKIGFPFFLANSYLYGIGCQQEFNKVYEMLSRPANGQLDFSSLRLGKSSQYMAQLYIGIANYFDKDKADHYKEAVRWLESVINSKESQGRDRGQALCLLARCYRFGRGVEKNIAKANELENESKKLLPEDDYLKFISHFTTSY